MFGYIDYNGIVSKTSLSTLFEHQKETVQKPAASTVSKDATEKEGETQDKNLKQQKASDSYQEARNYLDSGLGNVLAAQIMSQPVITVKPDTTIKDAWEIFQKKRFRHIPVISNQDKLIGIISDRDILKFGFDRDSNKDPEQKMLPVETIVNKNVLFAGPDADLRQIVYILIRKKIGAMPIINNQGFLLGIITRSDILKHFVSISYFNLSI